ncbi:hypothetical protein O3P69_018887 [Scylla paramamosain]|uniref:Uncharacterized protein n=1 Tax=Scylla paramamosain TaxID=85552 RepID=A0AAW0SEP8_SCYPA
MPLPGGPSSPGLVMPGVAMTDVRVLLPVVASSLSAGHSCHPFVFVSGGDLHLRINNRSELTVMFHCYKLQLSVFRWTITAPTQHLQRRPSDSTRTSASDAVLCEKFPKKDE